MEKITKDHPAAQSVDIMNENIGRLKELFPEAVTEGRIDFEVLRQLLGDEVDDRDEKYGLNWNGKRRARQLALTPSLGTLRPCPEESVDWDTTKNIFIEGDNLEVLKLLQKSYAGKVKLIYIDPPYNTGKDFVYKDDFQDNIKNYQMLIGARDNEGRMVEANSESSGRYHTEWLNMLYPRLRLARSLLKSDGVIFVSIADHEVHNLRIALNEIFGEENFIASVVWQKVFSPKNSAKHFSEDHDYILVYAQNSEIWRPRLLPRTEEMESRYNNPDNDERGPWTSGDLSARNYYGEGTYSIACPSGRVLAGPPPGTYWRVSDQKFQELDQDGRIWWGDSGGNVPRLKRFLSEVKSGRVPQTLWKYEEVGHTQEAKKEVLEAIEFLGDDPIFDTPKPTRLIQRMLQIGTTADEPDLVLDFFAGSGSTLHAVYKKNQEDGGNRRTILVQLPEPLASKTNKSTRTLADLTKDRLRGARKKIIAQFENDPPDFINEQDSTFNDLGFRVFKLDSSNIRAWNGDVEDLEDELDLSINHLVEGRSEQDVLCELLLKLGLELCVPIEDRTIAGKTVHSIGGGVLMACLETSIAKEGLEPLGQGIVARHQQQAPEGETQVVFRDSAFEDDVAKTNITAILEQNGIKTVRSL